MHKISTSLAGFALKWFLFNHNLFHVEFVWIELYRIGLGVVPYIYSNLRAKNQWTGTLTRKKIVHIYVKFQWF